MQICESWDEMEKKLQHILTDSAFSGAMKESCAWKALARALQLAEKQKQEDAEKVNQLQNQLDEQKLFTDALVGMVEKLRESQEREKQDAQLQLQKLLTLLHGVERDRDALRSEVGSRAVGFAGCGTETASLTPLLLRLELGQAGASLALESGGGMAEAWRRLQTHFERMQICESWDEMEKKLQHILTDSAFSGAMKESCAWKALARALQLAEKQKQEDAEKARFCQDICDSEREN
ncbi:Testis-Expressed Protein 13B [Manis pentadactyla]|nr:Testis-Expressed Protein 13B [Manis pentadactyla]